MKTKRQWKRKGRVYRFYANEGNAMIFAAEGCSLWAWGVWVRHSSAEGIEWSLKRAKEKANENLDRLLQPSIAEASR